MLALAVTRGGVVCIGPQIRVTLVDLSVETIAGKATITLHVWAPDHPQVHDKVFTVPFDDSLALDQSISVMFAKWMDFDRAKVAFDAPAATEVDRLEVRHTKLVLVARKLVKSVSFDDNSGRTRFVWIADNTPVQFGGFVGAQERGQIVFTDDDFVWPQNNSPLTVEELRALSFNRESYPPSRPDRASGSFGRQLQRLPAGGTSVPWSVRSSAAARGHSPPITATDRALRAAAMSRAASGEGLRPVVTLRTGEEEPALTRGVETGVSVRTVQLPAEPPRRRPLEAIACDVAALQNSLVAANLAFWCEATSGPPVLHWKGTSQPVDSDGLAAWVRSGHLFASDDGLFWLRGKHAEPFNVASYLGR